MGNRIREAIAKSDLNTALIGGRMFFKKIEGGYTARLDNVIFLVQEVDMPRHEKHVDWRKLSVRPLRK